MNTSIPQNFVFGKRLAVLGLATLLAAGSGLRAQQAQPAAPAAPATAATAPSAAELTTINQALRALVEKQDAATAPIFSKYPNFQLLRAPLVPAAPVSAVPAIPRDALPWTPANFNSVNPALPTLVIAGDSTAQTGPLGQRGWGALLIDYFDPAKINLVNQAIGGRSFRSFTYEGRWDNIVKALKPGDIVMIQFGHNDGTGNNIENPNGRPELGGIGEETRDITRTDGRVETVHTFGWYARKYIKEARDKGAIPIMMTSTVYNRWPNGTFARAGSNVNFARQVAEQEKVLLLDHTMIISDQYEKMGQEAVRPLFNPDNLHTSTLGAITNAEMFISGMKTLGVKPVVDALNDKGQAIPAYTPKAAAASAAQ